MTVKDRSCLSCDTPVPTGAMFCPKCGEATPTGIRRSTGELERPSKAEGGEAEYRDRLQRAIGDGYRLGELIGRGGFGVVYAAWEIELHREVAVKALRHDLFPTSELVERFKREARAAAKLRHPNIIPIYAVGEGEGIAYMIMPNIFGESLSATLKREGRLSVPESIKILTEAARALGVAQRAGIVHRDVKPENIFLEGDERRVYLMDFGIAKALEGDEEGLTGTGMIIGTPTFMSPEQAAGQHDIDHRADIYSLGVLGYQMLAGRLPYEAESLQDLIYQQVTSEPPAIRTLRADAPDNVAAAIHRCLPKEPDERWSTAEELVEALTGGTVASGALTKRRRMVWVAAAAVTVLAGVAVTFGIRGGGDAAEQAPAAVTAVVSNETDAGQAGALEGSVRDSIGNATLPSAAVPAVREAAGTEPPAQSQPVPQSQPQQAPVTEPTTPPSPVGPQVQAQPVGFLTVDATPWGMVQVDGVNVRESPVFRYELAPGTYVVSVVRDGYRTWSDTVEVTTGNTTSLRPRLIRQQG